MKRAALALVTCLAAGSALAEETSTPGAPAAASRGGDHNAHMGHAAAQACDEPKPECSVTATPFFAKDGRIWLIYAVGDTIYATSSRDNGKSFAPPLLVAKAEGATIDSNGEARPKLVVLPKGTLVASYATRPEKSYNGTIFTTRSTDGGKSFSKPRPLIDGAGQRFEIFALSPRGRLYIAWLDKRNAETAKAEGREFAGSGAAVAWSDDGGASFQGNKILMDHSCECCRMSAAFDRDGLPVFAWRHVFENNHRDHYAAKLSANGTALIGGRVSDDEWATTTCPHHGPSLAIDSGGRWHIVWFANGKKRRGLFYAHSFDGGKSFSAPQQFGDSERAPSHAYVAAAGGRLYRAWKEFDGVTTTVMLQTSRDRGASWSEAQVAASTEDASDHPLLIASKGTAYLSWLTRKEGYRLIPLARAQANVLPAAKAAAVNDAK
jgi:hypothetical protein